MTRIDTRTWVDPDQVARDREAADARGSLIPLPLAILGLALVALVAGLIYAAITFRNGLERLEEIDLRSEAVLVTQAIADHVEDEGSVPDDLTLTGTFVTLDGDPSVLALAYKHRIDWYVADGEEYRFCLVGRADVWAAYDSATNEMTSGSDDQGCAR